MAIISEVNGVIINNSKDMAKAIMTGGIDLFKQIEEAEEQLSKMVVVDNLSQVQVSAKNLYRLPCAGNSAVFEASLELVRDQPHKIRIIENVEVLKRHEHQVYDSYLNDGDRIAVREAYAIYEYVK